MSSKFSILRRLSRRSSLESSIGKPKFIGTPLFNVLLMLCLMLGVSGLFRLLEWRRMNAQTQIQINDTETKEAAEKEKNRLRHGAAQIFSGEVFETSLRLRETGAFGFAVCLAILDEARERRQIPGSINGLINAVTSRNLLPPGLIVEKGELQSETSKILIRYQPQPLQLELVSVPQEARFGPALMMRFPLITSDGKTIAYFQSAKIENIELPKAFAPAHEIIRGGWTLEAWRGAEIGGSSDEFSKMLAEEQERFKQIAPDNSDSRVR